VRTGVFPGRWRPSGAKGCVLTTRQDQDGRTAMAVRLPDEPIACSCRLQHSPVVDLVELKVPLDRVRVRGLLLQVGGSLRFPNPPTELQAMFDGFHRPKPWSPCLRPLAPCRLRLARPGLSGAARRQRSRYPGQPRQARSTSRAGPRHRRRSQSPLGWSRDGSVRSWVSVLAYCETPSYRWGSAVGVASPAPMPGLQATWPVRIPLRWPLTNPARVDWSSKPIGPITTTRVAPQGSRTRHIATGEHPLVHALVAGHHPLG
jgi:hypothetical protein